MHRLIAIIPLLIIYASANAQQISSLETGTIVELETVQSAVTGTFITASMERKDGKTRVLIHRSIDEGVSWTLIDSILPYEGDSEIPDPVLAFDAAGQLYLTLMRVRDTIPFTLTTVDLELYYSDDDGQSWSYRSSPHEADGVADYPQLTAGEAGHLFLVYTFIPDFGNISDSRLVFIKSTDGGLNWSERHELPAENLSSYGPDIAWLANETLMITTGNRLDKNIYTYFSDNLGENWNGSVLFELPVDESPQITKPVTHFSLGQYGILSHQAHQDDSPIVYHTLQADVPTSGVIAQGAYAEAYLEDNGKLHIIYNEKAGMDFFIRYIWSEDNGSTFSEPITLYTAPFGETGLGEYQSLIYGNDGLFYLTFCDWADQSSAKMLVFSPSISSVDFTVGKENYNIYPNPTSGIFKIEFPEGNKAQFVRLFSKEGSLLKELKVTKNHHQIEMDIAGLPAGMYLLQIVEAKRYLVKHLIKM